MTEGICLFEITKEVRVFSIGHENDVPIFMILWDGEPTFVKEIFGPNERK